METPEVLGLESGLVVGELPDLASLGVEDDVVLLHPLVSKVRDGETDL